MDKTAFIFGITGQDGSYLAELLLAKGYEVHGMVRRSSNFNTQRIGHLYADPHDNPRLHLHYGDICDASSVHSLLMETMPDEVYNLAAQSHVRVSFDMPTYTAQTILQGTLHVLEAIKTLRKYKPVRMYQASSSEQFGNAPAPQNENTPFQPCSPYAVAKVAAHQMCVLYREAEGLHVSCGILFNHESPRRGETFVTRKIAKAAARIAAGKRNEIYLGNLRAMRDWGFAGDYVQAMWLMLQQDKPDDYVVATGKSYSVQQFVDTAFNYVGLEPDKYVKFDQRYMRPVEVNQLCGDASKARSVLGWEPRVGFSELVKMMVDAEAFDCAGCDVGNLALMKGRNATCSG